MVESHYLEVKSQWQNWCHKWHKLKNAFKVWWNNQFTYNICSHVTEVCLKPTKHRPPSKKSGNGNLITYGEKKTPIPNFPSIWLLVNRKRWMLYFILHHLLQLLSSSTCAGMNSQKSFFFTYHSVVIKETLGHLSVKKVKSLVKWC